MLIRKFLQIELDRPVAVVDMVTAKMETKKDLKEKVRDEIRESRKPIITSENIT